MRVCDHCKDVNRDVNSVDIEIEIQREDEMHNLESRLDLCDGCLLKLCTLVNLDSELKRDMDLDVDMSEHVVEHKEVQCERSNT